MDRRENLRRTAAALRGKMRGRTYLYVQSQGLQAVGTGRSARQNMHAVSSTGNLVGPCHHKSCRGRKPLASAMQRKSAGSTVIEAAHTNALGPREWRKRRQTSRPYPFAPRTTGKSGTLIIDWESTALPRNTGSTCQLVVSLNHANRRLNSVRAVQAGQ